MSKHGQQASITDAETHTVLLQHLELTQLFMRVPYYTVIHCIRSSTTYAAQCTDVAFSPSPVIEFTEARPGPNQVSLAGTARPRGRG